MPESVLTIRTDEKVKKLFSELSEQGNFENKNDFFKRLLIAYQTEKVKKDVSIMKPAIEAAEVMHLRLLEILNGTAATIALNAEERSREAEEQKKALDGEKALFETQIAKLENERTTAKEQLTLIQAEMEASENRTAEMSSRLKELERAVTTGRELIEEYKEKNNALTGVVTEYKNAAEENKKIKAENRDLTAQIEAYKKAEAARAEEIERIKAILKFENEKAALELNAAHQKEMQKMFDEKNELNEAHRKEMQLQQERHNTQIAEYEQKIFKLIDEKTAQKTTD